MSLRNTLFRNTFPKVVKSGTEVGIRQGVLATAFKMTDGSYLDVEDVAPSDVLEYFSPEEVLTSLETAGEFFFYSPTNDNVICIFRDDREHWAGMWVIGRKAYFSLENLLVTEGLTTGSLSRTRPGPRRGLTNNFTAW